MRPPTAGYPERVVQFAKLDAPGRRIVHEAPADRPVGVLVLGFEPFDEEQLAELRSDGLRVRAVIGDVLTADASPDTIEVVTEQPFVRAVQVSSPLYPEGAPGSSAGGPSPDEAPRHGENPERDAGLGFDIA